MNIELSHLIFKIRCNCRHYEVPRGENGNAWKKLLKKQFPDEHEAIDKYFSKLDEHRPNVVVYGILRLVPLWVSWILIKTGIVHLMTTCFMSQYQKSALDVVSELTENKDLKTMMTYMWLDIGTRPSRAHFPVYSMIINHYRIGGASYPVGGASEFGMSLIPIVERGGGRVLVRDPKRKKVSQLRFIHFHIQFRSEQPLRRFCTMGRGYLGSA